MSVVASLERDNVVVVVFYNLKSDLIRRMYGLWWGWPYKKGSKKF